MPFADRTSARQHAEPREASAERGRADAAIRILFVDDDRVALTALQHALGGRQDRWQMAFAAGGQAALAHMADHMVDVVVADLDLAGMGGAKLLADVALRQPQTVRILRARRLERETLLGAMRWAHRFLPKSEGPAVVAAAIGRAVALKARLAAADLRLLMNGMSCLPSLPSVYQALFVEVTADEPSLNRIVALIEGDPPLTAKLLQIANFSPLAGRVRLTTAGQAARHLGTEMLKALVLKHAAIAQFPASLIDALPIEGLWRNALVMAASARAIAETERLSRTDLETTVTAAALHDIGALVLAVNRPDDYRRVLAAARQGASRLAAERAAFGVTADAVGAYLLDLWGMPQALVEAVAYYRDPAQADPPIGLPVLILHAASALLGESVETGDWPLASPALARRELSEVGRLAHIPDWSEMCRKLAQGSPAVAGRI